MISGF
jgi:hypothetical protein